MRIGLFGTMALIVFGICQFIRHLSSDSPVTLLSMLFSIVLFSIYVFGILRKRLKVTQVVYRTWWVLGIISLSIVFIGILVAGKWSEGFASLLTVLIILSCLGLPFGLITLLLWEGLRGLERIVEAEKSQMKISRPKKLKQTLSP